MLNPRDIVLLMDTATAAQRIIAFTEGMDAPGFQEDSQTHGSLAHGSAEHPSSAASSSRTPGGPERRVAALAAKRKVLLETPEISA